jgi:pimeloyl-ACP methyl ester carboxylesterase
MNMTTGELRMAQKSIGYVEINGGKLYYEIEGEGPTLVLGHAGFVDSRMWDSQWDAFKQYYRVLRYDLRGYGKSDVATGPVNRRADLYQLLTALKVERAVMLGCSMSGEVAIDFTLEHPEMVTALIPVSATPVGFQMQGEPPPLMMEMIAAAQAGDLDRTSELQIQLWVDGSRRADQVDPAMRRLASDMNKIAVNNRTFMIADTQGIDPLDPPAVERLGQIHVPTLIIAGAYDHPELVRAAEVMHKAIPKAQKVILQGGHVPNMDQPDEFNRIVLAFLDGMRLSN